MGEATFTLRPVTTQVEQTLATIWRQVLLCDEIGVEDDFFQLGGDSLAAAQVLAECEQEFGQRLPLSVFLDASTLQALAMLLDQPPFSTSWSSLVPLQPTGSRTPFFCVHGVGGCVLGFADLARHFPADQPFYGIRAAGLQDGEQPFACIEDMASFYLQEMRTVQPEGPYYLGGFSFGGSVALEMAQQLHRQGEHVALLAILDHTPPPLRYQRFTWTPTLPFDLAINTLRWVAEDVWRAGAGKRAATLKQKAAAALSQLGGSFRRAVPASGKTDVQTIFGDKPIPELFRHLLEGHYQILRDYRPQSYPGPVALFRAQTRPLLRYHGKDLGWNQLAQGELKIITVPGNHETMLHEPHVSFLAEALLACLKESAEQQHSCE